MKTTTQRAYRAKEMDIACIRCAANFLKNDTHVKQIKVKDNEVCHYCGKPVKKYRNGVKAPTGGSN